MRAEILTDFSLSQKLFPYFYPNKLKKTAQSCFLVLDRNSLNFRLHNHTQGYCESYKKTKVSVPKNKNELILVIENSYSKLEIDLNDIPSELTKIKELDGHAKGTEMSISDLVAYLIGWSELVLKWNQRKDNKQNVDFPETGYKWNQLGALAQKFYSDYNNLDYKSLLNKLNSNVYLILELIKANENAELYEKPWYDKWTKGKMIQLNTSSPYKNARSRVRKWKKLNAEKIRTHNKNYN